MTNPGYPSVWLAKPLFRRLVRKCSSGHPDETSDSFACLLQDLQGMVDDGTVSKFLRQKEAVAGAYNLPRGHLRLPAFTRNCSQIYTETFLV